MPADDMRSRRERAAAAFAARRGELDLTQDEVANRAGVVVRTVFNIEHGVWPNPRTRAKLEKAVGWPLGELHRLASPPQELMDAQLVDRLRELTAEEREGAIRFLVSLRDGDSPEPHRRRRGG